MLNKLGVTFALASLLLGAVLLYDTVPAPDLTQTAKVIAGAVFFALGLVTISLIAKDWWEWRKRNKGAPGSAPIGPPQD